MPTSSFTGTIVEIRKHVVKVAVDGNGHAFLPIDSLSYQLRSKLVVGVRLRVIERKRADEDTGEWIVKLIKPGEYVWTRNPKPGGGS